MKKALSLLLAIVLMLSCVSSLSNVFAVDSTSGVCGENLVWAYDEKKATLTISGTGAMNNFSNSNSNSSQSPITTAPWQGFIQELKNIVISSGVTSIGKYAFCSCYSLESITISNTVKSIGDHAFDSSSFSKKPLKLTLPDSVTSIGDYAFTECLCLEAVTIPDSVTSMGRYAFFGCLNMRSATIGNGLKSICDAAFEWCVNLESITLPNDITSIGNWSFWNCQSLESVTVPNSVTSIGAGAFGHCISLKSIHIGNRVKTIDYQAFDSCVNLTSIALPNSVTKLGRYAFNLCVNLKTVILPAGITHVAVGTFHLAPTDEELKELRESRSIGCEDIIKQVNAHPNGSLSDVYYAGSQQQWSGSIESQNDELLKANIVYNAAVAELCDLSLNAKDTVALNPEIVAANNARYTVKYESSKPRVAAVNEKGEVTGLRYGTSTVCCTVTNAAGVTVTTTCKVKVNYTSKQWLIVVLLFGWLWY